LIPRWTSRVTYVQWSDDPIRSQVAAIVETNTRWSRRY